MKICMLSDTHGRHESVVVPQCDILVHCGDFSTFGKAADIVNFANWFEQQPGIKVAVAGNHDWLFETQPTAAQFIFRSRGIQYLQDQVIDICGAKFYGSPQTPLFMDWAFNVQRGPDIKKYWDRIPQHTDVLITHGPPHGVLDQSAPHLNSEHLGCEELSLAVERVNPRLHVFGHIHGSYGKVDLADTTFVNAALVNEAYAPGRIPWVVDL